MIHLSTRGADYLQRVRDLGPAIDAAADDIERRRDLPPELFASLREHGRHLLLIGARKCTNNICFRSQWQRYQLDAKRLCRLLDSRFVKCR